MDCVIEKTDNYYEILNINKNASCNEIKKAYKKLVMQFHPDVNNEENSTEIFKKISKAYSILKNDSLRYDYDRQLRQNESFIPIIDFKYCYRLFREKSDELLKKFKIIFKNIYGTKSPSFKYQIDKDFFNFDIPLQDDILNMPIKELEERLQYSDNNFVRINAAIALGCKMEKKCYTTLEKMINNKNENVARAVIWAIGNLKMKKSLSLLELLYGKNDGKIKLEILKSYYKIVNGKGHIFNNLLINALNSNNNEELTKGALSLLLNSSLKINYNDIKGLIDNTTVKCRLLLDKILSLNKIQNYPEL